MIKYGLDGDEVKMDFSWFRLAYEFKYVPKNAL